MSNCFAADIVVGAGAVAAGVGAAPVVAAVGVAAAGAYAVAHRDEIAQGVKDAVTYFKEHTSNQRPSTNDKHTKPRPGRATEKKKQKPEWRPNPNKRKK